MNKHTPGPWELNKRGYIFYIDNQDSVIASCHGDVFGIDQPTAEANARLIAAAPQMLEALKLAIDLLDEYQTMYKHPDNIDEAIENIKYVYETAKGEQEWL